MGAWNRWAAEVAGEGNGRLHPVAHLTLRDLDWLDDQLRDLAAAGVRLAMIAPALVDGRPLSHPDLDRASRATIWRTMLRTAGLTLTEGSEDELAEAELNGRQIRNLTRLARIIHPGREVTLEQMRAVLKYGCA